MRDRALQLIRAVLVAAMLLPFAASAAGAMCPLAHYTHQRWSEESDPPRVVADLTHRRLQVRPLEVSA